MYLLLIAILGVSFLAGCVPPAGDTTAPLVNSTAPVDATTGVALNGSINVTFSEAMDAATINGDTFTVKAGATPVAGAVTYDASSNTANFAPSSNLAASTVYTATVTTGVKTVAGDALAANMVWSFQTGSAVDTTPPTVAGTVPGNSATGVALGDSITAHFSEAMNIATINATNFTLKAGSTPVPGTVTYDIPNKSASFDPTAILTANTVYTATITTGAKDAAGNALAADKVWTFTTIVSVGLGPAPVRLGTAGNFAILAKTGISTVPASAITGDIGVSPVAESYMTGFSQTNGTGYATSPQVTGFMYAANMAPPTPAKMTTAISDMQTAYTDAAGRPLPNFLNLGAGTLSGNTLAPGLYKWGTGLIITGNITISGAADDVWIFQVSGTLTESNGIHVILGGAAQAKNIFWQVSGAVILGTTSVFKGNILGQTGITLLTGATMSGRALAQSAVTLQQAIVVKP